MGLSRNPRHLIIIKRILSRRTDEHVPGTQRGKTNTYAAASKRSLPTNCQPAVSTFRSVAYLPHSEGGGAEERYPFTRSRVSVIMCFYA